MAMDYYALLRNLETSNELVHFAVEWLPLTIRSVDQIKLELEQCQLNNQSNFCWKYLQRKSCSILAEHSLVANNKIAK